MAQDGVPIQFIQKWLGHADLKTTQIYAHLAPDSLDSAAWTPANRVTGNGTNRTGDEGEEQSGLLEQ